MNNENNVYSPNASQNSPQIPVWKTTTDFSKSPPQYHQEQNIDPANTAPVQPQINNQATKNESKSPIIIMAIIFFVFLVGAGSVFSFYILPRQNTLKTIDKLDPMAKTLIKTTEDLDSVINSLHTLVTEESQPNLNPKLETTGLMIRPNISSLMLNTNVLGESDNNFGVFGQKILDVGKKFIQGLKMFVSAGDNVAGVTTTADDPFTTSIRTIKNESQKADKSASDAQDILQELVDESKNNSILISEDVKNKLSVSENLEDTAGTYFSEAKKISVYYDNLCDLLITMNTKISSFQNSMKSAGTVMGNLMQNSKSIPESKTMLGQVKVFLNQANTDMQEIHKMSENLKSFSDVNLPMASKDYHLHNIKMLESVDSYFTSGLTIMQSFVTSTNTIITKAESNKLTRQDMVNFQKQALSNMTSASISDAKFVSDLMSLMNEEKSLTLSFWQNNTIISSAGNVKTEIENYQMGLKKLRQNNSLPFGI